MPPRLGGEEKKLMIGNLGEIISRDTNPRKVDTVEQWIDLIFIFAGVYLSGHPAKAIELLKYIQSVRMRTSREPYGGKSSTYNIGYVRLNTQPYHRGGGGGRF